MPRDLDGLAHDRTSCASCQGSHRIEPPAIREGAESQALRALVLLRAEGRARSELTELDDEEPEVIEERRLRERRAPERSL